MKIAILGAGNWGTTLAIRFSQAGHDVALWEHDTAQANLVRSTRKNEKFLPGFEIPSAVLISSSFAESIEKCEVIFLAIPAQSCRQVVKQLNGTNAVLVSLIKGIEQISLNRVSEICFGEIKSLKENQFAALSGPTIANEIASGLPASAVVASESLETAKKIQKEFSQSNFRLYTLDDVVGVEIAGALKNIIAIAAGICDGMRIGSNAKGALITRGLAEMSKLGEALGGKRATFSGLSGLGDLVTTCTSQHSRNRRVGERIGKGESLENILSEAGMIVEGIWTSRAARDLTAQNNVQAPITNAVCSILFEGKDAKIALKELMDRDLKAEN